MRARTRCASRRPYGPFFLFTDSLHVRLTGDLRNLFAGDLQRVLVPGFHQDIVVAAVDSNFYDYYRTNNDPFTGGGIISRVKGGSACSGRSYAVEFWNAHGRLRIDGADRGAISVSGCVSSGAAPPTAYMTIYLESRARAAIRRTRSPAATPPRTVASTA